MRNESLVVEVQGYEVQDPVVTIEYQQPIARADEPINPAYIYLILGTALLALGLTFFIIKQRKGGRKAAIPEAQQIDDSTKSVMRRSHLINRRSG
jgi:hypothetical protein